MIRRLAVAVVDVPLLAGLVAVGLTLAAAQLVLGAVEGALEVER